MLDKELIKQEIKRLINDKTDGEHVAKADVIAPKRSAYLDILQFIDSLPEEPTSEDLEEEVDRYYSDWQFDDDTVYEDMRNICRHFAEWQKQQMMKDAVEGEVRKGYVGNQIAVSSKDEHVEYVAFDASYADAFCVGEKVRIVILKENTL